MSGQLFRGHEAHEGLVDQQSPIEIEYRDRISGGNKRPNTVTVRCLICGAPLKGADAGDQNLAEHLKSSEQCRARIDAWLSERVDGYDEEGGHA